jgi:hypothetical protein
MEENDAEIYEKTWKWHAVRPPTKRHGENDISRGAGETTMVRQENYNFVC